MKNNCRFCFLDKSEKIIYKSPSFIFLESKFPLIKGHCLLLSKKHIRKEGELSKRQLVEYHTISNKAFKYIKRKYALEPLVFINPPHQQSVSHFHKHYLPGVFGINGVQDGLKKILEEKNYLNT